MDNLSYAYVGNRLQAIDDAITGNQLAKPASYHGAPTSLAGDFQEAGVRQGQEYLYDANGNLTADKNKGITGIAYNHLNLPRQIHFGQVGDSVVFRYSAAGQKVAKLVYQTGKPLQRTDYLGPYQYEQDSLKFFPHAEGRVLRFVSYDNANQAKVRYQREYTLKDHLGNLRLAYRAGQVRTLTAGLELDQPTVHQRETQQFDSLSVSPPIAQSVGTLVARTGSHVALLNAGGTVPHPLGPLTQLTVQKGDSIRALAFGYYPQPVSNHSFGFSLASFVAGLLQPAPAGQPAGPDGRRRGGLPLLQLGLGAGLATLPQLRDDAPKGYLRVLIFNEDSVLVDSRTLQLTPTAHNGYDSLRTGYLPIRQNGYVTVYVGNESPVDVYFDDISVEHRQNLQVQENQYDPWGLALAGVNYSSPGIQGMNQYQFNGKEQQIDLGLGWSDYGARFYDPARGPIWMGLDPLADKMRRWSPYNFSFDNSLRFVDPDGMAPISLNAGDSFDDTKPKGSHPQIEGANTHYIAQDGPGGKGGQGATLPVEDGKPTVALDFAYVTGHLPKDAPVGVYQFAKMYNPIEFKPYHSNGPNPYSPARYPDAIDITINTNFFLGGGESRSYTAMLMMSGRHPGFQLFGNADMGFGYDVSAGAGLGFTYFEDKDNWRDNYSGHFGSASVGLLGLGASYGVSLDENFRYLNPYQHFGVSFSAGTKQIPLAPYGGAATIGNTWKVWPK